ncbi:hypothetical protein [Anaerococcus tetradius]|uniref:Uncharacterized protein n=1 Tax=Anaerococcus tetradius ATCC 35098 TaxID=525255 RepID=C2CFZ5_9FIRM|nr:hypothetical protein [Anaerococcus tetradius]EEI83523.1 hypothetical protein HMPREF0077_0405 [Anaerococcus tetradius ATCC 35098]
MSKGRKTKLNFKVWDSKFDIWAHFMIIDNMLFVMEPFTGVWIRDDEQKRFKLKRAKKEVEE